jgi:hypothetical protein
MNPKYTRAVADVDSSVRVVREVHAQLGARLPRGWTKFSRCANAEPAPAASEPDLVRRAEELMRVGGYEADDSARSRGRGRQWFKVTASSDERAAPRRRRPATTPEIAPARFRLRNREGCLC